jgi:hypothetical protein
MPEKKTENELEKNVNEELQATRLVAFLDFYSDRATAHASLFVASLFGLFTQLTIVQSMSSHPDLFVWLSIPVFFGLTYAGYFTLVRFGFYSNIAQRITEGLKEHSTFRKVIVHVKGKDTDLCTYLLTSSRSQRKILFPKEIISRLGAGGLALLGISYWGITLFFGTIVYSKILQYWGHWMFWIMILVVLVLFFVILPFTKPLWYSIFYKTADKQKIKHRW